MRSFLLLTTTLAVLTSATTGLAQIDATSPPPATTTQSAPTEVDPVRRDAILKLLELSGAAKMGEQMIGQMTRSMRLAMPQVPQAFWDEFMNEFKAEEVVQLIVPIYEKHLSAEDVDGLTEFYQSPLGQRLVAAMPSISRESMQVGQMWGQQVGQRIGQKLQANGLIDEQGRPKQPPQQQQQQQQQQQPQDGTAVPESE